MEGIVIIITPNTVQLLRTEEYFQRDITTQQAVVPLVHLAGGLMGSGIAPALILSGYLVILKEVNDKFLQAGLERIKANLQSRVKKGKMSEEKFENIFSLVQGAVDYESFRDVDMVIEAVIENVALK